MSIRTFVGDFETTVYEGQEFTEVWASACVEMHTENVVIFGDIDSTFDFLVKLGCNVDIYYHNLKFDGSFWMSYLLKRGDFTQAYIKHPGETIDVDWIEDKDMQNNTFKYLISEMGQWYSMTIKINNHIIKIKDSHKLLPFSVKRMGKSFKTKHQKTEIEYTGFRYANCPISAEERQYIANDVLVVKECLEILFSEGHNGVTIGSCCLKEFMKTYDKNDYKAMFPNIYEIELDKEVYGSANAGEYIRKSYHGGWCYVVKGKEECMKFDGCTADVNSLYPSMMHSESGNLYPIGKPTFWKGNRFPLNVKQPGIYYFVRLRTRFKLKDGKLPCIQVKSSLMYSGKEWLTTSDVWDAEQGRYFDHYIGFDGEVKQSIVEMTITMTDYQLIQEHYDLYDTEILDGCWFYGEVGIFDEYIDHYKKIKITSKGAVRELAKLFLNNLYGKMATNMNSSFKVAYLKENGVVGYATVCKNDKTPGYIPCGTAITSYARNFTIRAAQKNYHGVHKRGFCYADTDSIHCDLHPDELVGVPLHDTDFCKWKLESQWDMATFTRQKTYIEHIIAEEGKMVYPYFVVKCSGMPDKCKNLLKLSMSDKTVEDLQNEGVWDKLTESEKEFVKEKRTIQSLKRGLKIPSCLKAKTIVGGVLLQETTYEMR